MIADVDETMRVFHEEIFGPVLVAMPFGDEAEAVRLANATRYGLAAYVWTNDAAARAPRRAVRSTPACAGSTRRTCATCARRSAA